MRNAVVPKFARRPAKGRAVKAPPLRSLNGLSIEELNRRVGTWKAERAEECRRVVGFLDKHGGYFTAAQIASGLGQDDVEHIDDVLMGLLDEGRVDARITSGTWWYGMPAPAAVVSVERGTEKVPLSEAEALAGLSRHWGCSADAARERAILRTAAHEGALREAGVNA